MSADREQFSSDNQGSMALKVSEILSLDVGKAKGPEGRTEFFR